MAKVIRSKKQPGETLFGGGRGVILVGSSSSRSAPSLAATTASAMSKDELERGEQAQMAEFSALELRLLGQSPSSATASPETAPQPSMPGTSAGSPAAS